jgi:hypothetical protein
VRILLLDAVFLGTALVLGTAVAGVFLAGAALYDLRQGARLDRSRGDR